MPDHGGLSWDSSIKDGLDALAPISSEELHPDPELRAIVALVSAAAGLIALWLAIRRRWRDVLFLAGSIGGTVALSSLTKLVVQRAAIEGSGNDSFPSGTAAWAAAVAVAAVLLAPERARALVAAVGAACVLAYSAVIAWEEWHYPSDILAAWCLALGWVCLLGSVLLPAGRRHGRSVAAESGAGPWGRARPSKSAPSE